MKSLAAGESVVLSGGGGGGRGQGRRGVRGKGQCVHAYHTHHLSLWVLYSRIPESTRRPAFFPVFHVLGGEAKETWVGDGLVLGKNLLRDTYYYIHLYIQVWCGGGVGVARPSCCTVLVSWLISPLIVYHLLDRFVCAIFFSCMLCSCGACASTQQPVWP